MNQRSWQHSPPGDRLLDPLPEGFVQRQRDLLGASFPDWRACLEAPWPAAFRVNTLLARPEAVRDELRALGLHPEPLDFRADAFWVPEPERPDLVRSAAANEARVYLQTPSSMVPPMVLAPQPGEEVLDMAAAPGGKTLVMAAAMGGRGRIAAVERSRSRFFRLRSTCRAYGARCVQTYLQDGAGLWRKTP